MDIKEKNHFFRGVLCTLLGGTAWGFSGACGQILTQHQGIEAIHITFIRMLFAGLILSLIHILKEKKAAFCIFFSIKSIVTLVLFAVFGLILSQLAYLMTISYSNAGMATVLQYLGPVFIMLAVCIFERCSPKKSEIASSIFFISHPRAFHKPVFYKF